MIEIIIEEKETESCQSCGITNDRLGRKVPLRKWKEKKGEWGGWFCEGCLERIEYDEEMYHNEIKYL